MSKKTTARRRLRDHVQQGVVQVLEQLVELRANYPGVAFDLPSVETDDDLVSQALDILRERVSEGTIDTRYRTIAIALPLPGRDGGFLMIDVDPTLAQSALSQ